MHGPTLARFQNGGALPIFVAAPNLGPTFSSSFFPSRLGFCAHDNRPVEATLPPPPKSPPGPIAGGRVRRGRCRVCAGEMSQGFSFSSLFSSSASPANATNGLTATTTTATSDDSSSGGLTTPIFDHRHAAGTGRPASFIATEDTSGATMAAKEDEYEGRPPYLHVRVADWLLWVQLARQGSGADDSCGRP